MDPLNHAQAILAEYVLPYWPWIVAAIIGLFVVRFLLSRAMGLVWLLIAVVSFSGVGISGVLTWLADRGWLQWWPFEGLGLG